jgi:hypothetical protein
VSVARQRLRGSQISFRSNLEFRRLILPRLHPQRYALLRDFLRLAGCCPQILHCQPLIRYPLARRATIKSTEKLQLHPFHPGLVAVLEYVTLP